ncbi:MAG: MoxR family ATPase [Deltaproteobacteria bacterium]|nr:MoxR family ATPase [Deltaproteobacteria bacterium]
MSSQAAASASVSIEKTAAIRDVQANIAKVIRGKEEAIKLSLAALLARGHLLIEDIPGVGKTTLARALAASLGGSFRRVQFTSDLLPSDIIGVSVYNSQDGTFDFRKGPIFSNVVLADEINRTTPRTQSALLEAMSEGQVSVDDTTYELGEPFLVLATQNPAEHFGTYPLPESQMDRFLLRIRIGYPDRSVEREILKERGSGDPVAALEPVIDFETLKSLQDSVEAVPVDDQLIDYAMSVVDETRNSPVLSVGVSTRGALAWYRAAQAFALVDGRDYCIPDDFKELAVPALAHRVVLAVAQDSLGRAREESERAIEDILSRVPVPT